MDDLVGTLLSVNVGTMARQNLEGLILYLDLSTSSSEDSQSLSMQFSETPSSKGMHKLLSSGFTTFHHDCESKLSGRDANVID